MKFRLAEVAQRDLFEIWAFIALRDQGAADKMERQILEACGRLAERPDLGHFRRDLTVRDLQFFNVRGFCLIGTNPNPSH
jgi:antitoxin ParD1/3/4/toxin ParE1/3/4